MKKRRMKQWLDVASTVAVLVAAGFFIWTQVEARWFGQTAPIQVEDVNGLTIPASAIRNVEGDGLIALIEFTDYQCPYCGRHAQTTSRTIREELTKAGRIRHVVFNFPLDVIHPHARAAAEAAECAGRQGRFWDMHERIFEKQEEITTESLSAVGVDIGLDGEAFNKCREGEAAQDVDADVVEARRLGVESTPTFFVGRVLQDGSIKLVKRLRGALPYQRFSDAIKEASPQAQASR